MKPLIIFDLDGTLVDSLPDIAWSLNQALKDEGLPTYPESTIQSFIGSGTQKLLERAAQGEVRESLANAYRSYYDANLICRTTVYPGIQELLSGLTNCCLAVVTNKYQSAADTIVNHFFPGVFHQIIGDGSFARKPDPASVRSLMSQYGTDVTHTILVGDSEVDQETAKQAGISFVGVDWGYDILNESVDFNRLRDHLRDFIKR